MKKMKKDSFYGLLYLTLFSFCLLVVSCTKSCRKDIMSYFPFLVEKQFVENKQNLSKDIEKISFSYQGISLEGKIDENQKMIFVDLSTQSPDDSFRLESYQLSDQFSSFEYELKPILDPNTQLLTGLSIQKFGNSVLEYKISFQKQENTTDFAEKDPFLQTDEKKLIQKIQFKNSNGNLIIATIEDNQIIVPSAFENETFTIAVIIPENLDGIYLGDTWKINQKKTIFEDLNGVTYVLMANQIKKPVTGKVTHVPKKKTQTQKWTSKKPNKDKKSSTQEQKIAQKEQTTEKPNKDKKSSTQEQKIAQKEQKTEKPNKDKKSSTQEQKIAENSTQKKISDEQMPIFELVLKNQKTGNTLPLSLDTNQNIFSIELPANEKSKFKLEKIKLPDNFRLKGLDTNQLLKVGDILNFSLIKGKNKQNFTLQILSTPVEITQKEVFIQLQTQVPGFVGLGDLEKPLQVLIQKKKEDKDPKNTEKSKLITGKIEFFLDEKLIYTLEEIKVGKRENILDVDTLHQVLLGKNNFGKSIKINFTSKEGNLLGTEILRQSQYEIRTAQDLSNIYMDLEGEYRQMNDIVYQNNTKLTPKKMEDFSVDEGFIPLGDEFHPFEGRYNGNNFKISDIFITSSFENVGLFGMIGSNAKLENIQLELSKSEEIAIYGNKNTGALVGMNNGGLIENCHVSGSGIQGTGFVGALVGYNKGIVLESSAQIFVQIKEENFKEIRAIGGLIGFNEDGTLSDLEFEGTIDGKNAFSTGGAVGQNKNGILTQIKIQAKIHGKNNTGGLVGINQNGSISNVFISSESIIGESKVAGLIAENIGATVLLSGVEATSIIGEQDVAGLIGYNKKSDIIASFARSSVQSKNTVAGFIAYQEGGLLLYNYSEGEVMSKKNAAQFIVNSKKTKIKSCFSLNTIKNSKEKTVFIKKQKSTDLMDTYYLGNSDKKSKQKGLFPINSENEIIALLSNVVFESSIAVNPLPPNDLVFKNENNKLRLWWEN